MGLYTCYKLCLLLLVQVAFTADFYALLGIGRDADQAEIKRAYRKQSLLYHPDKNPGKCQSNMNFAQGTRRRQANSPK